jgi:mRNA interferase RelE/StbE
VNHSLHITPSARRHFRKLPAGVQTSIREKLDVLCEAPFQSGLDVKKLRGREGYRLRVGDYRVIYRLDSEQLIVEVLDVGHRREIYH